MTADRELLEAALVGYLFRRDQIEARVAEIRRELGISRGAASKGIVHSGAGESGALTSPAGTAKKRRISAAGIRRIAEATRKRWAAYRAQKALAAKKTAKKPAARKAGRKAAAKRASKAAARRSAGKPAAAAAEQPST